MKSLIYVSRRTGIPDAGSSDVDDILRIARARNADLDVTGALVATPLHFAQMLEGPQRALAELIASINNDKRHKIIHLIDLPPVAHREFDGWSLAYHGDSSYVASMLADAIAAPDFDLATHVDRLRSLMRMFS